MCCSLSFLHLHTLYLQIAPALHISWKTGPCFLLPCSRHNRNASLASEWGTLQTSFHPGITLLLHVHLISEPFVQLLIWSSKDVSWHTLSSYSHESSQIVLRDLAELVFTLSCFLRESSFLGSSKLHSYHRGLSITRQFYKIEMLKCYVPWCFYKTHLCIMHI